MMDRIHAMATKGEPNLAAQPNWPSYRVDTAPYLHLDLEGDKVLEHLRPEDLQPLQMGYHLKPE